MMILSGTEVEQYGREYEGVIKIGLPHSTFEAYVVAKLVGQDRENRVRLDRLPLHKIPLENGFYWTAAAD